MSFRLSFLISLFIGSASLVGGQTNIVMILVDDLGWKDPGCYGSTYYETPNIDALAASGMRFTSAYSCGPNCSPSRAALWSGRYGSRTGIYSVSNVEDAYMASQAKLWSAKNTLNLSRTNITLAETLQTNGYITALFGKWHMGNNLFHPTNQGFGEAIVSAGKHYSFSTDPAQTDYTTNTYLSDYITTKSIAFIENNATNAFFLVVDHFAPHAPLEAPTNLVSYFEAKGSTDGQTNAVYAAMIAKLDESVGAIVTRLEELSLLTNTIVMFLSDNGGVAGSVREGFTSVKDATDNSPLRWGKGTLYEGGLRVPQIVHWPGVIRGGSVCDDPVSSVDVYPTILDMLGLAAPTNYVLDGASFAASIGEIPQCRPPVYWHFPTYLNWDTSNQAWRTTPCGAIRSGPWKLLEFFEDGRTELYKLTEDIGETNNLASTLPLVASQMKADLALWRTNVNAKMPLVNLWSNSPPVILEQPQSLILPWKGFATFTIDVAGIAPFSFQWFHNSTNLVGTKQTYDRVSIGALQTGNYFCVVSNALGIAQSDTVTLTLE